MPVNSHIAALITKHLQDTLTEQEAQTLNEWIAVNENNRTLFSRLTDNDSLPVLLKEYTESNQRIKDRVYAELQLPEEDSTLIVTPNRNVSWMRWVSVAAAVVVLGFVGIRYWWPKETVTTTVPGQPPVATVIPAGGNKATLTLADGTVIDLDKAGNGEIATQGKTSVSKRDGGQLEYSKSNVLLADNAPTFNLLSTPRGGQYQLLLPDGSKVWLNAASSIKYPTAFTGNERKVEITGEAYFEIARNDAKPFKVMAYPAGGTGKGGEVVVGTHFNINAYGDEQPIVTTLLEGKIKIAEINIAQSQSGSSNGSNNKQQTINHKLLSPGEEAQIGEKAGIKIRKNVDTESAVAWMKGFFDFHQASTKTVMKQVSRWYNVDIEYADAIPAQTFEGSLDRNIPLNELLTLLQQMGTTKFQIEGRTIKVK